MEFGIPKLFLLCCLRGSQWGETQRCTVATKYDAVSGHVESLSNSRTGIKTLAETASYMPVLLSPGSCILILRNHIVQMEISKLIFSRLKK